MPDHMIIQDTAGQGLTIAPVLILSQCTNQPTTIPPLSFGRSPEKEKVSQFMPGSESLVLSPIEKCLLLQGCIETHEMHFYAACEDCDATVALASLKTATQKSLKNG